MSTTCPVWRIPKHLKKLVDTDEGGMWEDTRWDPILLTVMGGTSYGGRDIPLAWQIEFEPGDERLEAANKRTEALGLDPDGYGWSTAIERAFAEKHPSLAGELHSGDTESSTCVIWVESESTCRALIELVWSLIHAKTD